MLDSIPCSCAVWGRDLNDYERKGSMARSERAEDAEVDGRVTKKDNIRNEHADIIAAWLNAFLRN